MHQLFNWHRLKDPCWTSASRMGIWIWQGRSYPLPCLSYLFYLPCLLHKLLPLLPHQSPHSPVSLCAYLYSTTSSAPTAAALANTLWHVCITLRWHSSTIRLHTIGLLLNKLYCSQIPRGMTSGAIWQGKENRDEGEDVQKFECSKTKYGLQLSCTTSGRKC